MDRSFEIALRRMDVPEDLVRLVRDLCSTCRVNSTIDDSIISISWLGEGDTLKYEILVYPSETGTEFSLHLKPSTISDLRQIIRCVNQARRRLRTR